MKDQNTLLGKAAIKLISVNFYILISLSIAACSSGNQENSESDIFGLYTIPLDHIRSQARDGHPENRAIYWIDTNKMLLPASVKEDGGLHFGLYEVDIGGTFKKLARIDWPGFNLCKSNGKVFLFSANGESEIEENNFELEIYAQKKQKLNGRRWSGVRCDYISVPEGDLSAYTILNNEDGFFERRVPLDRIGEANTRQVFRKSEEVTTRRWNTDWFKSNKEQKIWSLAVLHNDEETKTQVGENYPFLSGFKQYSYFNDAYYGYLREESCIEFWWLFRKNWIVEFERICLPEKYSEVGLILQPTKAGMFVTSRGITSGVYFVTKDHRFISLEKGRFDGASTSPDGCMVAYLERYPDSYQRSSTDFNSFLRVFDACLFIQDKAIRTE